MYALGAELGHGAMGVEAVYEFFSCGLIGHAGEPTGAKRMAKKASPRKG
jgi:hypothetical protein